MNWSIVLNVLLLVVVVGAIIRTFKLRQTKATIYYEPNALSTAPAVEDDIIAVRKINPEIKITPPTVQVESAKPETISRDNPTSEPSNLLGPTIVMFLSAKDNTSFKGYELLQTLLTSGLRFGEGNLFHRHHDNYGQGPIMCSVAAATASGTFDLQNMEALNIRGLCVFMQGCLNPGIDADRFEVMTKTAQQLAHNLDAHWLNQDKQPISQESLQNYKKILGIEEALATI